GSRSLYFDITPAAECVDWVGPSCRQWMPSAAHGLVGIADDRLREEEDLALVGVAPLLLHPGLERILVLLHLVHRLPGDDDVRGVAGLEVLPPAAGADLGQSGQPP